MDVLFLVYFSMDNMNLKSVFFRSSLFFKLGIKKTINRERTPKKPYVNEGTRGKQRLGVLEWGGEAGGKFIA